MKSLTKAEEQVMEAIWSIRQGFLRDIIEALGPSAPHPNTVATILKILIEKGYVVFEPQGRNNLYKTKVSRDLYAKRSFLKVMKTYFGGSPSNIVSHLVSDHDMSIKELEELLKQIKSSKK